MGGPVSLLRNKQPVTYSGMISDQARNVATQAMPAARNAGTLAAQQAVPLARNAGTSMKQGADSAVAWATPYVGQARHWAAPLLEQGASAVTETVAPIVSDALRTAAQRIDYVEPKQKRRLSLTTVLAGSLLLTAAGAAAAYSLRHRNGNGNGYSADTEMTTDASGPAGSINDGYGPDDPGLPNPEGNGHQNIV
jgi:hypothetical protein